MSDKLSQAEVESLLNEMEVQRGGATTAEPTTTAAPPRRPPAPRSTTGELRELARPLEKVTPYDFKRPERVGKDQMRALQTMHEGFGRNFGAALSALLRAIVEVKLTSVDQLTYSEFVFSLENPTCFNLINAEPLEGQVILDINPSLLFPIIDRLLGGGNDASPPARRPLTEIELRLVGRITDLFLIEMKHAWANVIDLKLSVDRVESNPQLVQIVPPNEVVVLISFELTLGEARGMMNLCVPFNSIERIGSKLSANNWATYSKRAPTDESIAAISQSISGSIVEVVAELAATNIATSDLIGLRVGDIIATEKDVNQPLVVSVQGREKFRATCGTYKGRKAIQVTQEIPQQATKESATEAQ